MKYTITINQIALAQTSLDLIDAAILEYLYIYCTTPNEKIESQRILDDSGYWTWIDYEKILSDLPMLRIKSKGALSPRINKLATEEFIATKKFAGFRIYMRILPRIESAFIKQNAESNNSEPAFTKTNASVHENESQRSPKRTNTYTSNNNTKILTSTNVEEAKLPKKIDKRNVDIQEGIDLLRSYYSISKEPQNRYALKRLYQSKGKDRVFKALKFAYEMREDEFCPSICNYLDLEQKWHNLENYARKLTKERRGYGKDNNRQAIDARNL